jgi:hypothetical protein
MAGADDEDVGFDHAWSRPDCHLDVSNVSIEDPEPRTAISDHARNTARTGWHGAM